MDAREYIAERDNIQTSPIDTELRQLLMETLTMWHQDNKHNDGPHDDLRGIITLLEHILSDLQELVRKDLALKYTNANPK